MGRAKDIRIEPITPSDGRRIIRSLHYSGKVDTRSAVHLGVFLNGRCGGAIQLGTSMDKRRTIGLVKGTEWNEYIEIHRIALAEWLPRNSESRSLAVLIRLLRRHYPHLRWLLSYADGCQCGDGTIYRAAGFVLTGIRKNATMYRMPDGEVIANIVLQPGFSPGTGDDSPIKRKYGKRGSETAGAFLRRIGAEKLPGYQLRYIYFLDPAYRDRLTVPEIPYSRIDEMEIGMYKGKKRASEA